MVRTSLIYDHFDLYLTPVTLTFNLPEKMFQMALLLLEGNNYAKLFLKSMHKLIFMVPKGFEPLTFDCIGVLKTLLTVNRIKINENYQDKILLFIKARKHIIDKNLVSGYCGVLWFCEF